MSNCALWKQIKTSVTQLLKEQNLKQCQLSIPYYCYSAEAVTAWVCRWLLVAFSRCFSPTQCGAHSSYSIADGKPWVMTPPCPMILFSLRDVSGLWSLLISSGQLKSSPLASLPASMYARAAMRLCGCLKLKGSHHMVPIC